MEHDEDAQIFIEELTDDYEAALVRHSEYWARSLGGTRVSREWVQIASRSMYRSPRWWQALYGPAGGLFGGGALSGVLAILAAESDPSDPMLVVTTASTVLAVVLLVIHARLVRDFR